jgi:hypothetical protein
MVADNLELKPQSSAIAADPVQAMDYSVLVDANCGSMLRHRHLQLPRLTATQKAAAMDSRLRGNDGGWGMTVDLKFMLSGSDLVSWHLVVDLLRPSIDATSHTLSGREALLTQPIRYPQTASAVMAMHHDMLASEIAKLSRSCLNL